MSLRERTETEIADSEAPDGIEHHVTEAWRMAFGERFAYPGARILDVRTGAGRVNKLLAEIERRTGVALPMTVVFQAGTVAELASIIRAGRPPAFAPAILLKDGNNGPPMFLFPGLGGSVFQLFDLARLIAYGGPIYLNQQVGLSGEQTPHRSIQEMAQFQLDVIRNIQPTGPYRLLGYSLGGVLALEVARCLLGAGETVRFVGLIEPGLPEQLWPWRERVAFFGRRIRHHAGKLRSMPRRAAFGYVVGHAHSLYGRIARLLGFEKVRWSPYRVADGQPELLALREANIEAMQGYKLEPYPGRVVLFTSAAGDPLNCNPLKVWPLYIKDLGVVSVPGGHETMLRGKNVVSLAASVAECVAAATLVDTCDASIRGAAR